MYLFSFILSLHKWQKSVFLPVEHRSLQMTKAKPWYLFIYLFIYYWIIK